MHLDSVRCRNGFSPVGGASNASNCTLIANGGSAGGVGGTVQFLVDSVGGTARVEVFGSGNLDISAHDAPGVIVGSLEGNGIVFLEATNLTVGSNNLSTIFAGTIQDGGFGGGTGGSFTKAGTATLTLTKANTYTGGTTVSAGILLARNIGGSAAGSGAVQANAGILAGTGRIAGGVTIGRGSGPGAFLSPGRSPAVPAPLTLQKTLTFSSDATYTFGLKSSNATADKVVAKGVTINSGARFNFVGIGTGTLTAGPVFTVIDNTATTPIAGTLSNLADNSIFTANGNTFQASYEGGTGNDLTLTVQ